jgi:hypothetical protein
MDGEACDGENSECRNVSDLFWGRMVFWYRGLGGGVGQGQAQGGLVLCLEARGAPNGGGVGGRRRSVNECETKGIQGTRPVFVDSTGLKYLVIVP